eukprot:Pgem_evm1s2163
MRTKKEQWTKIKELSKRYDIPIPEGLTDMKGVLDYFETCAENRKAVNTSDILIENMDQVHGEVVKRQKNINEIINMNRKNLIEYNQNTILSEKIAIEQNVIEQYFQFAHGYNSTKNERLKALRRRVDIKYLKTDVNSWLFYCSVERSQILKPKIVVIKVYGKVFKNKEGEKTNMVETIEQAECMLPQTITKQCKICKLHSSCMHIRAALYRLMEIGSRGSTDEDNTWRKFAHSNILEIISAFPEGYHKYVDSSNLQAKYDPFLYCDYPKKIDLSQFSIVRDKLTAFRKEKISFLPENQRDRGMKIDILYATDKNGSDVE